MIARLHRIRSRGVVGSLACHMMVMLALSAAGATPVSAQGLPRAFRGLFRATDDPSLIRHRLDLSAALFAGLVRADVDGTVTSEDERLLGASYQGLSTALSYGFRGRLTSFQSLTGASFQHYSGIPGFRPTRYFERVEFRAHLGPRTDLTMRGGAFYSPYYAFAIAADPEAEAGEIPFDVQDQQVVVARENLRLDAGIDLTHRPTPRSQVAVDYGFGNTRFLDEGLALSNHRAGIRYGHGLTEHARLQLGYVFHQWARAGAGDSAIRGHDARIGIDYNRAIFSSPRTRFGLDLGTAVAQQPDILRVDVTGTTFIARQLTPRWVTALSYSRGFDVRAGLDEPVYYVSDTAALSLSGTVARRAALRLVGSYVRSTFAVDVLENRTRSWNGTAGISFAVARVISVFAQSSVSTLRFSATLGPILGLPTVVDRFTCLGGLAISFPLVR